MKKIIAIALTTTLAWGVYAQDNANTNADNQGKGSARYNANKERVEAMKAKKAEFKKDLNLSPEQEAKMKEIHQNRNEQMKARREQDKEFRKNLNEKTKQDVDAILTPEQKAKMDQKRAEHKDKMQNHRNKNGKHRRPNQQDAPQGSTPVETAPSGR